MSPKPSQSESEFFAREEQEKLHRLSEQKKREEEAKAKESNRNIHFMKCPKCGADLKYAKLGLVDVEECTQCDALVLDKGALDKIKGTNHSLLKSLIDVFNKDS